MTTAFQTGPGLFAANSDATDDSIPSGLMRIFCVRLEAYDLDVNEQADLNTSFKIIFAEADGNAKIARALLVLAEAIEGNRKMLEESANS